MKKFAIIGHDISYSASPRMHLAAMTELELDGQFEVIDLPPEQFTDFITGPFRRDYTGAAITKPYKQTIIPLLDDLTEAADRIGAVNTITNHDGRLQGTNTDGLGALAALRSVIDPTDKRVLVLGAGGAARAVAYALTTAEAKVKIWNRSLDRARQLSTDLGINTLADLTLADPADYDIIINTTTVGLRTDVSLLPAQWWRRTHTAFDIVYDPLETRFLREAATAGAVTLTGDTMLVHQAVAQFTLWHSVPIAPEVMGEAFFNESM